MPSEKISIGNQTFDVLDYDYDYDYEEGDEGSNKNPMVEVLEKFNNDYPKYMNGLVDFHRLVGYIDQVRYCVFALTVLAYVAVIAYLVIHCYYSKKNCEKWLKQAIMKRELELRKLMAEGKSGSSNINLTTTSLIAHPAENQYSPSSPSRDHNSNKSLIPPNQHTLLLHDRSPLLASANHHPLHTTRDTDSSVTLAYLADEDVEGGKIPKPTITPATTPFGSPKVGVRSANSIKSGMRLNEQSSPRAVARWEDERVHRSTPSPNAATVHREDLGSNSGSLPRSKNRLHQ